MKRIGSSHRCFRDQMKEGGADKWPAGSFLGSLIDVGVRCKGDRPAGLARSLIQPPACALLSAWPNRCLGHWIASSRRAFHDGITAATAHLCRRLRNFEHGLRDRSWRHRCGLGLRVGIVPLGATRLRLGRLGSANGGVLLIAPCSLHRLHTVRGRSGA